MFRRLPFLLLVVTVGLSGCAFKEAPLPEPPSGPDVFLKPDTTVVEDAVPRNATLATLLASHDMPSDLAYQFVEALREVPRGAIEPDRVEGCDLSAARETVESRRRVLQPRGRHHHLSSLAARLKVETGG